MQKQNPLEGKVRELLMMWEDKEKCTAPLSNVQKDSYISLTMQDMDDLPEGVKNINLIKFEVFTRISNY